MVRHWGKRLFYDRTFRFSMVVAVIVVGALVQAIAPWFQETVTGRAVIVDGDSLKIGGNRLRLEGIDAPELAQDCLRAGRSWACGEAAKTYLARLIDGAEVNCTVSQRDRYGRLLSRCRIGKTDINRTMIIDGMAVAFSQFYRREENEARANRRGLWAGEFVRPQVWRRDNPRE